MGWRSDLQVNSPKGSFSPPTPGPTFSQGPGPEGRRNGGRNQGPPKTFERHLTSSAPERAVGDGRPSADRRLPPAKYCRGIPPLDSGVAFLSRRPTAGPTFLFRAPRSRPSPQAPQSGVGDSCVMHDNKPAGPARCGVVLTCMSRIHQGGLPHSTAAKAGSA